MIVTKAQAAVLVARLAQDAPQRAAGRTGRVARTTPRSVPTEEQEQVWYVAWFDACQDELRGARVFHIANGGARSEATGARMKAAGVRPGVWDLLIAYCVGNEVGLAIEMKRRDKRNHLSDAQADWGRYFFSQRWATLVCYGAVDAAVATLKYLAIDDDTRRALLEQLPMEARL